MTGARAPLLDLQVWARTVLEAGGSLSPRGRPAGAPGPLPGFYIEFRILETFFIVNLLPSRNSRSELRFMTLVLNPRESNYFENTLLWIFKTTEC